MEFIDVQLEYVGGPDLGYLSFDQLEEAIDPFNDHNGIAESIAQPIWNEMLRDRLGNMAILHTPYELTHFIHSKDEQWISLGELTIEDTTIDNPEQVGLCELINLDTVEDMLTTGVHSFSAGTEYFLLGLVAKRRSKIADYSNL